MTKFLQILLLIVAVLWFEVNGKPFFQGMSFDINFKPLPIKPITFIKEKWSPFGLFGRKHSLQKRNSGSGTVPISQASPVVPLASEVSESRPAAPVFEHVEETEQLPPMIIPTQQIPGSVIPVAVPSAAPPLVSPIQPQLISYGRPIVSSPASPSMPLSVIVTPVPSPVFSNGPPPSITSEVINTPSNNPVTSNVPISVPPIRMEGSLPPLSANMLIPPAPGRFTDISRAEPVREYMNYIQPVPPALAIEETAVAPLETNSIKPVEPPKDDNVVINDNSFFRRSKLALYYGSIFLQLVSQFMSNARATFNQMTNPPPRYNN